MPRHVTRLSRTYFDPGTWQNGGRFRRAEPGALPRLPGVPRHMPGAGFLATLSNFQNLQITSWCSNLLRPRAVEVPKKGMKEEFQLNKSNAKKFARSTACRRYLTRLSRKKDGALLALLRRSRLTSGCPWGAGTVSFVVSGRNREFFVA